jgi:hypothetical protein
MIPFSSCAFPVDCPNREMVALAPSTMSIFMRNRKNRIIAVDRP